MRIIFAFILNKKRSILQLIIIICGIAFNACDNSDGDEIPEVTCRLISSTIHGTTKGVNTTSSYDHELTYTYDERGNRLSSRLNSQQNSSDGTKTGQSSTTNFEFDKDGFLTRRLSQDSWINNGVTTSQSYDIRYEYQNDLVTKQTVIYTTGGISRTTTYKYEYDNDGRFIKFLNLNDNSYQEYDYLNNHVVKITFVDALGSATSPYLEFNSNGQLLKSIIMDGATTQEYRYTYNGNGMLVRMEVYKNGKAEQAVEYEYDNKTHPSKSEPLLKGHPKFPQTQAYVGHEHNVIKTTNYKGNEAGGWQLSATFLHLLEYNSNDLPIRNITKYLDHLGQEYASENIVMEYQCN
jgi:YD repeat-containing protein